MLQAATQAGSDKADEADEEDEGSGEEDEGSGEEDEGSAASLYFEPQKQLVHATDAPSVCVTGPRNWVGLGGRDPSEVSPCPPAFPPPPALSLPPTTPPPIPIPAGAVDHLRRRSQSSAPQTTEAGRAGAGAAAGPGAAHFRGGNGGIKHTVAYPIDVQDMKEQGQSRCTQQQAGTAGNRL